MRPCGAAAAPRLRELGQGDAWAERGTRPARGRGRHRLHVRRPDCLGARAASEEELEARAGSGCGPEASGWQAPEGAVVSRTPASSKSWTSASAGCREAGPLAAVSFGLLPFHHPIDTALGHMKHLRDLRHRPVEPLDEEADPRVAELLVKEEPRAQMALESYYFEVHPRRPLMGIVGDTLGNGTRFRIRTEAWGACELSIRVLRQPRAVLVDDTHAVPTEGPILILGACLKPPLEIGRASCRERV